MKFAAAALLGLASAFDKDVEAGFQKFIVQYGKSYGTKEEYTFRLGEFAKKVEFIQKYQAENDDGHQVAPNHMMDWTHSEYKKLLGYNANQKKNS